ncbi:hypothetical protein Lalb_Chr08g0232281 [Lupinus albus]|uniref:Knottin, scorpion toxin n=1 Tax=Lupinus albus TaxID=3870 RepID=A0A6A4Q214_LUPAL|nr:hypothetical protein Lalb_Chr08g0232281 [Lupinus albus]
MACHNYKTCLLLILSLLLILGAGPSKGFTKEFIPIELCTNTPDCDRDCRPNFPKGGFCMPVPEDPRLYCFCLK